MVIVTQFYNPENFDSDNYRNIKTRNANYVNLKDLRNLRFYINNN